MTYKHAASYSDQDNVEDGDCIYPLYKHPAFMIDTRVIFRLNTVNVGRHIHVPTMLSQRIHLLKYTQSNNL